MYSHSPRRSTVQLLSPSSPKAQQASAWYTTACWGLNSTVTLHSSPGFNCPVSGDSWNGGSTYHLNPVCSLLVEKCAFTGFKIQLPLWPPTVVSHKIIPKVLYCEIQSIWNIPYGSCMLFSHSNTSSPGITKEEAGLGAVLGSTGWQHHRVWNLQGMMRNHSSQRHMECAFLTLKLYSVHILTLERARQERRIYTNPKYIFA